MQFLVNDIIRKVDINNKVLTNIEGHGKIIEVNEQKIIVKWFLPVIIDKRSQLEIVNKTYSISEINELLLQKQIKLKNSDIWIDKKNRCFNNDGKEVDYPHEFFRKQEKERKHITDPVLEK